MGDMYLEIFKNMSEGLAVHKIICDKDGNPIDYVFLDVNHAFEEITGIKKEEIVGKTVLSVMPKIEKVWIEKYGVVALTGEIIEFEQYTAELDKFFQVRAFSVKKGEFVTLFVDITKRKKTELLLEKYKFFFENAGDILLFIGMDGRILDANNTAVKLYGYSKEELLEMNIIDLRYNDDADYVSTQMMEVNKDGILFEANHKKKDGTMIPVQVNSTSIKIGDENVLMSIIRDITEQKNYREKINYMAYHDSLTDLPNRKFFTKRLKYALYEAEKNKNKLSVMFFDIDKFKSINDIYGHDIGDVILVEIANRIKKTIDNNGLAARFGGDEFVLFQSFIKDEKEACTLAEKILDVVKMPVQVNGYEINLTTSIGISIYPDTGKDIEELLKQADIAMYIVKSSGRGSYRIYKK